MRKSYLLFTLNWIKGKVYGCWPNTNLWKWNVLSKAAEPDVQLYNTSYLTLFFSCDLEPIVASKNDAFCMLSENRC